MEKLNQQKNTVMHAVYGATKDGKEFLHFQGNSESDAMRAVFLWVKENAIRKDDMAVFYMAHIDLENLRFGEHVLKPSFEDLFLEDDGSVVIVAKDGENPLYSIGTDCLKAGGNVMKVVKTGSKLIKKCMRKGTKNAVINKGGCKYTICFGEMVQVRVE